MGHSDYGRAVRLLQGLSGEKANRHLTATKGAECIRWRGMPPHHRVRPLDRDDSSDLRGSARCFDRDAFRHELTARYVERGEITVALLLQAHHGFHELTLCIHLPGHDEALAVAADV